jgi:hypothetical protein
MKSSQIGSECGGKRGIALDNRFSRRGQCFFGLDLLISALFRGCDLFDCDSCERRSLIVLKIF